MKLFDSMRNQANKAIVDADRMTRIRREQTAIDQLQAQVSSELLALGQAAQAAHRAGVGLPEALVAGCRRLDALQVKIDECKANIEAIRREAIAPAGAALRCGACGQPVQAGAGFCPTCGSRIQAPPAVAGRRCAFCHAQVPAEAVFCPGCGKPAPASPPLPAARCPSCSAALAPGAIFCPDCGQPISPQAPVRAAPVQSAPVPVVPVQSVSAPALRCGNCMLALPPDAVFCPDCGTTVNAGATAGVAPASATPPAAPVWPEPEARPVLGPEADPAAETETLAAPPTMVPPVVEAPEGPSMPAAAAAVARRCGACGTELRAQALFCPTCGLQTLAPAAQDSSAGASTPAAPPPDTRRSCPVCQLQLPGEALFCPDCGTLLGSSQA